MPENPNNPSEAGGLQVLGAPWYYTHTAGHPIISTLLFPAIGAALGYGAGKVKKWWDEEPDNESAKRFALLGGLGGLGYAGIGNTLTGQYQDMFSKKSDYTGLSDYPYGGGYGIPVEHSLDMIFTDPYLSPIQKAQGLAVIDQAAQDAKNHGVISWSDVSRAAIGAGIGYGTAKLFGKVTSGIFGGLDPVTQKRLQNAGVIAGILVNTGLLR